MAGTAEAVYNRQDGPDGWRRMGDGELAAATGSTSVTFNAHRQRLALGGTAGHLMRRRVRHRAPTTGRPPQFHAAA